MYGSSATKATHVCIAVSHSVIIFAEIPITLPIPGRLFSEDTTSLSEKQNHGFWLLSLRIAPRPSSEYLSSIKSNSCMFQGHVTNVACRVLGSMQHWVETVIETIHVKMSLWQPFLRRRQTSFMTFKVPLGSLLM